MLLEPIQLLFSLISKRLQTNLKKKIFTKKIILNLPLKYSAALLETHEANLFEYISVGVYIQNCECRCLPPMDCKVVILYYYFKTQQKIAFIRDDLLLIFDVDYRNGIHQHSSTSAYEALLKTIA